MTILVDKEMYMPGDVIKGSVFMDLFQPSSCKDIFIQFKGSTKISREIASLVDENEANKADKSHGRGFDLKPDNLFRQEQ